MSTRGFLIEILLYRYNAEHKKVICFIIHLYYSQIKITFSQNIYCCLYILNFSHDYDVTTLEIIRTITFRKYTKHPIKALQK